MLITIFFCVGQTLNKQLLGMLSLCSLVAGVAKLRPTGRIWLADQFNLAHHIPCACGMILSLLCYNTF